MDRLVSLIAGLLLFHFFVERMARAATANDLTPTVADLTQLTKPGRHRMVLRVDNHDRKIIVVTPRGFQAGERLPVVFFFHGAGGSAQQASHTYGWAEKADAENFFAVFPEGLPLVPESGGRFHIWRDERGENPMDISDVHFFEVLLDQLQAALPIDPHRIYVSGFSNGAGMAFTLGAHFSDRIAAIAPVSSQSFAHAETLARALPVYYLTGTADPLIPYLGGESTITTLSFLVGQSYPPVQDSVDQWVKLDGCPPEPRVVSDANGVRVLRYGPGRGGSEVMFTTIVGNGHHWPTSVEPLPHAISGPTLDPINATDQIWEFFQRHPRP